MSTHILTNILEVRPRRAAPAARVEPLEGRRLMAANGLTAQYFDNVDFTNLKLTRTDETVDFNWRRGSPDASIGKDSFSVRWTGQVEVPQDGRYAFKVRANNGVRLWVDGEVLIDRFDRTRTRKAKARVDLPAGRHDIKLEYFEVTGKARVHLRWSANGMKEQVVPPTALFVNDEQPGGQPQPVDTGVGGGNPAPGQEPGGPGTTPGTGETPGTGANPDPGTTPPADPGAPSTPGTDPVAGPGETPGGTGGTPAPGETPGGTPNPDGTGGAPTPEPTPAPTPQPPAPSAPESIGGFRLYDADSDRVIPGYEQMPDGVVLDLAALPSRNINIGANVAGGVRSVQFVYDPRLNTDRRDGRRPVGLEVGAPFTLVGDRNGDVYGFTPSVGTHRITATPYAGQAATGEAGATVSFTFVVIDSAQG